MGGALWGLGSGWVLWVLGLRGGFGFFGGAKRRTLITTVILVGFSREGLCGYLTEARRLTGGDLVPLFSTFVVLVEHTEI